MAPRAPVAAIIIADTSPVWGPDAASCTACAAVDTDVVALDLKDENSQCIARPLGGEDLAYEYVYIVMPMRIG